MWIENFITSFAHKENARYLRFSPGTSLAVPPKHDNIPTLLYLHVPFCEELCPYCSFHRGVFQEPLARDYFAAVRKEIILYKNLGYDFKAVYVGGGTPTILIDELIRTLALIKKTYSTTEISIETNPNHLTKENIALLKEAEVNRLSVGVQSFDDDLLKAMERYHKYGSGQQIVERLKLAQGNFNTLNVDMIFNFPPQTPELLEKDIETILALAVDQVTYYPLMVSASTQGLIKKKLGVVRYEREKKFYQMITSLLSPAYKPATAWCFSRSKAMIDEYVVNFEEYAGIGSGAIGYLRGSAYANTFDIKEYIRIVNEEKLPITAKKDFSLKERARYDFLMKLFGLQLDLDALKAKVGKNINRYLWSEILFFRMAGGLKKQGNRLLLTKKGQYYWVIMMREFFIGVNNFRDYCREMLKFS
jgi:coproporphyrinogen III oxidase-like Fe-S oxidoreductase